ncbi:cytochrome P450 [Paraburkholderia xenovorans]|uniref:cytochrome P450 n=1 Tax=Paraburkholderia xenovorans TaxID=36873 RepID=UPI0038B876A9
MKFSDLSSLSFYENPYPLYDDLRAEGPLVPLGPHSLISGHYEVVEALLLDRRMGKNYLESVRVRYGDEAARQPVFQGISRMFLMLNPPVHTRLRSLMMKAFNARQVEVMREIAYSTANRLIDAFVHDDTVDLVRQYALPLPVEIIARLLDVPIEDATKLGEATSQFVRVLEAAPLPPDELSAANSAYETLERYFVEVVDTRRTRLGSDLISMLLSVEENGEALTPDEVVSNVILFFVAGHETTSNMIGNALIALYRHPEQLAALKRDPSRLPAAVAECVRYDSAVQMVVRIAQEDVEVGGMTVPRNTLVFLALGAANRDPSRFDQPERLDFEREPSRLLSFGGGIHYCLGYRLAMLELEAALGTLLARLPNLRLLNLDELRWHRRLTLRGVETLTAKW